MLIVMESPKVRPRPSIKRIVSDAVSRRREKSKLDSDEDRKRVIEAIRQHAEGIETEEPISVFKDIRIKKVYSRTFMHPDSMLDVPADLHANWSVLLRPEGERCLVILRSHTVTVRGRNGSVLVEFVLSPFEVKRTESVCIFDAVWGVDEARMKPALFVFDVLYFNLNDVCMSDFSCRQFWLNTHWPFFSKGGSPPALMDDSDSPSILLLAALPASSENIRKLYLSPEAGFPAAANVRFEPDSLIFFRNDQKYENGLTQAALVFRDPQLSRFCIDSKNLDGFEGDEEMEIVLRVILSKEEIRLCTWDRVVLASFTLAEAPAAVLAQAKRSKRNQALVRVVVNSSFEFVQFHSSKKPFPSSMNRIIDQVRRRRLAGQEMTGAHEGVLFTAPPVSIDSLLVSG